MSNGLIDPFGQETAQRACGALGEEWSETICVFRAAKIIEWTDLEEFNEHDPKNPDGGHPILGAREMLELLKDRAHDVVMARGLALVAVTDRANEEWERYVIIDIREKGHDT